MTALPLPCFLFLPLFLCARKTMLLHLIDVVYHHKNRSKVLQIHLGIGNISIRFRAIKLVLLFCYHPSVGWLELMVTWWWQIRLQSRGSKIRTLDPEVPWSMAQISLTAAGSSSVICNMMRNEATAFQKSSENFPLVEQSRLAPLSRSMQQIAAFSY